ncbi:MAG: hypothetical protein EZS28_029523, partial [Streblomastix strix]
SRNVSLDAPCHRYKTRSFLSLGIFPDEDILPDFNPETAIAEEQKIASKEQADEYQNAAVKYFKVKFADNQVQTKKLKNAISGDQNENFSFDFDPIKTLKRQVLLELWDYDTLEIMIRLGMLTYLFRSAKMLVVVKINGAGDNYGQKVGQPDAVVLYEVPNEKIAVKQRQQSFAFTGVEYKSRTVEVRFGGLDYETKHMKDTLKAEFNEEYTFAFYPIKTLERQILVELWDYDTVGDNNQFENASIQISEFSIRKKKINIDFSEGNESSSMSFDPAEFETLIEHEPLQSIASASLIFFTTESATNDKTLEEIGQYKATLYIKQWALYSSLYGETRIVGGWEIDLGQKNVDIEFLKPLSDSDEEEEDEEYKQEKSKPDIPTNLKRMSTFFVSEGLVFTRRLIPIFMNEGSFNLNEIAGNNEQIEGYKVSINKLISTTLLAIGEISLSTIYRK